MQRPDLRTLADERVVVLDGATGTGLQLLDLSLSDFDGLEGCNEVLNVSRPDAVAALHESYLEAGADAVLTNTFGGSSITLGEYELSERTREINRESARIARSVVDRFSTAERPRYVLGSLGPGTKLPSLGHVGFDELHAAYLEQARGLLEGEVDALLVETVYDLLQGKAAILACKDALAEFKSDTPLFATVTIETTGQMLVGSEIGAAFTALAPLGLDGIGLNCATGPDLMHEPLRY
ncbi:MAG: methionine synthase, partial [Chloroflexi bacterium]|nr:methionine synthase [Chloroflexota bacterium]